MRVAQLNGAAFERREAVAAPRAATGVQSCTEDVDRSPRLEAVGLLGRTRRTGWRPSAVTLLTRAFGLLGVAPAPPA